DQDPQRVEVRARRDRRRRRRRGHRGARSIDAAVADRPRRGRHRCVRGVRLLARARAHGAVLLGLLRRLRRAREAACVRRRRPARSGLGPAGPRARALDVAAAVRTAPPFRHRGGVVVVGGGLHPPGELARPRAAAGRDGRCRTAHLPRRRRRPGRDPQGEDVPPEVVARRGGARRRAGHVRAPGGTETRARRRPASRTRPSGVRAAPSGRVRRRGRAGRGRGLTLDIREARSWLDAHVNLESTGLPAGADRRAAAPTLARIQALVRLLGSPQESYPVIHLTGTNGKPSAARMTSALLVASGLSVGTYTSPHLEEVNERIVWNGEPADDATLAELLSRIADV